MRNLQIKGPHILGGQKKQILGAGACLAVGLFPLSSVFCDPTSPLRATWVMSEGAVLCCAQSLQSHPTLGNPMDCTRLLCAWDSPGKNTGVGCHTLLQGISPIQGLNLGFLHCRQILYHLSQQGSPLTSYK